MKPFGLIFAIVYSLFVGTHFSFGQSEAVRMVESFSVGQRCAVDLRVELSGQISAPGKSAAIEMNGISVLKYDECVLAKDDGDGERVLRIYRDVSFSRSLAGEVQKQEIRPAVRRMVVMRSPNGKKAPFSPDGPLTFGEIDAVRVDLFNPVLVTGLLPKQAVRSGEKWTASEAAVLDLTGLDKIESGKLTVEYLGTVTVGGRNRYRLAISGNITGVSEDGPTRQAIDATAYFDPTENRLAYLSLKGSQELLDGKGNTVGRLVGRFTMNRTTSMTKELSVDGIAKIETKPTVENTLLLYENPDLGLRFVHPRNWRVGVVQGKQVTVEDPKAGGGILITTESDDRTPTVEEYRKEATEFLTTQKGRVLANGPARRVDGFDRFRIDAELSGDKVRMEYAVRNERGVGGVTFAARIPAERVREMSVEVERILKELKRYKP